MRKSKKFGEAMHFLKKHCRISKNEAEQLYYIVRCKKNYTVKSAREMLADYQNNKIEFNTESSYYKRLLKITNRVG